MVKHTEQQKENKGVDSYIMILACVLLCLLMFLIVMPNRDNHSVTLKKYHIKWQCCRTPLN
jgi:hypothetical protein